MSRSPTTMNGVELSVDKIEPNTEKEAISAPKATPAGTSAPTSAGTEEVAFTKLLTFAEPLDIVLMVFGSIAALSNGAVLPLFSLVFGRLLDAFGDESINLESLIATYALYFVFIGIGAFVVSYMQVAFWTIAGERQSRRIREEYLRVILRQDIGWFDVSETQELTSRIAGDTVKMQEAISEKVGNFLQFTGTTLAGFIMGFIQGWQMTLVMMAAVPLLAIAGGFMAKMLATLSQRGQAAYAKAGGVAEEVLSSIRTVVSFVGEEREFDRYKVMLKEAMDVGMRKALVMGAGLGMTMLIMFSSYSLAFWYGSKLIVDGTINTTTGKPFTGGDIVTVFFSVLMGAFAIGQASPNLTYFAAGRGAGYHFFKTRARVPAIDPNPNGVRLQTVEGQISFRGIRFEYPARPGIVVAQNLNLEFAAGEQVALVGESGSGKSTIINLLERFYDPIDGQVLFDGVDIKTMDLRWLRTQIGLVSQEPALFTTSILENIRYGMPTATQAEVEQAATMANIHAFICKLPDGYNTEVGDRGVQLSGGQKQRVAIARAIIRNPRVLLLDEATSALDNESEKVVQAALDRLMIGRTTIVIAHRLSTIRRANKIVVMSKGNVMEQGTHEQLVGMNGHYAHLLALQQSAGLSEDESAKSGRAMTDDEIAAEDKVLNTDHLRKRGISSSGENGAASTAANTGNASKKEDDGKKEIEFEEVSENYKVPVPRILGLAKGKVPLFIVGLIAALANGTTMPLFAIIFSDIVTVFYIVDPNQQREQASFWACMFLVLGGGVFIANTLQQWGLGSIGETITTRMRELTFYSMLHQDIAFFDDEKHSTGMLTTRLSREATLVQGVTTGSMGLMVQNIATLVTALIIAFANGWKLALLILGLLPLLAGSGFLQMKLMSGFAAQGAHEQAGKLATNAIEHIRTVTAFVADERLMEMYSARLEGPLRSGLRKAHISGVGLGSSMLIMFGSYGLCFWVGSRLVASGDMTFGEVLKVFFAIMMSAMGLGQTSSFAPDMRKAKSACQALFSIVDRVPPIQSLLEGTKLPEIVGNIEFRDLHFSYPARSEVKVLNGLSLQIPAGTQCALVGSSGCGKSTLISLVQRFYDPASGTVFIDGIDIRTLDLKWLRRNIGLVSQEPVLFATTIIGNILYGRPEATQAEAEQAAASANAHSFIIQQPQSYNTDVGDRGIQMSGGQKQRIAIARALVKNPRILLLDEATSALDSDSEKVVQEALNHLMIGRTTIVIAHRLSTVVGCTKIAVVEQGRISEEGPHMELLQRGGLYSVLAGKSGISLHQQQQQQQQQQYYYPQQQYYPEQQEGATVQLYNGY